MQTPVDLSTRYLGLDLPHPLMPGASPLVDDIGLVRRLEDAGAAAIVLHSLFEEQLRAEQWAAHAAIEEPSNSFAEASTYLPSPMDFRLGPHEYLEQLLKIRQAVAVPVIASLNGTSWGGWLDYARQIEQAGADALEINLYQVVTDPDRSGELVEVEMLAVVGELASMLHIPVAVKLSPFYTALAHFAKRLVEVGAKGLVLFNRFYQPDLDIEALETKRKLHLSDSSELLLRLRWLAILSGRVETSYAVTGGVHTAEDALKAIFAGADVVQVVSLLLKEGPEALISLRSQMSDWLEDHEYESLAQAKGSLNLMKTPDPSAYERVNYMQILQSWEPRRHY